MCDSKIEKKKFSEIENTSFCVFGSNFGSQNANKKLQKKN